MFFRLNSLELGLIVFGILLGTTLLGAFAGRHLRTRTELREPFGVLQAALLGLVALVLAFGLTMAVGRYDSRRAAVVDEANAIGTTYLRAQTLREPMRTRSLRTSSGTRTRASGSRMPFPAAGLRWRQSRTGAACSAPSGDLRASRSPARPETARHASTWSR